MAFGIGINTEVPDRGLVRGRQEDAACGCWFTSKGELLPKLVKYRDWEGMIHSMWKFEILYFEKQNFCGIPMMMYECRTLDGTQERYFTLLFHIEECTWKIIWK